MLPGKSSSSTTNSKQSSRSVCNKKEEMGMWLSLKPPGSYNCTICNKVFNSIQAIGGHQNAHRAQRMQLRMHAYMKLRKEEERQRQIQEENRIIDHSSYNCTAVTVPEMANYHQEESETDDLGLNLALGHPKGVMEFIDFMPIKRMESGDGGGGHKKVSIAVGEPAGTGFFCGGKDNMDVASKNGLDLTLKL